MNQDIVIILSIFGGTFFLLLIILIIMKNRKKRKYRKLLDELEYRKNEISSVPVSPELAKVEEYLNGEKLENMYKGWQERLNNIREEKLPLITDMLIDAEDTLQNKDYKSTMYKIAKLEMELYKVKTKSDFLLDEIKNITNGEERNRAVITELKAKYRQILQKFNNTKLEFGQMAEPVQMQFENITSLFEDFEVAIEENNFEEIGNIVRAVKGMLNHLEVVVDEMPSVVLIAENILPKKMEEVTEIYEKMKAEGYPLDYLNVEFNIEEANKKIIDILDRARVLNLENSLFELKVLTEYFESLFTDFEKEKIIKNDYSQADKTLKNKMDKMNDLVTEIFSQMEELKNTYKLEETDIKTLEEVKNELDELNSDYNALSNHENNHNFAYSRLTDEVETLAMRLSKLEDKLDKLLDTIGSMHDDEMRARQQLDEVNTLLKDAKSQIRKYNLPVVPNNYYVELKEASEAIKEIVKELDKKPVTIETLNTRVDTARDLVLKLFGKTKEMMKTAMFAEMAIVYGNRYRSHEKELDKNLIYSEALFNKGEYQKSLELTINSLNRIEPGIYEKLLDLYGEKIK